MNITINLTGLDTLAASIDNLAGALKAGVKADQIIDVAKASSRKPKPAAPEAAPVVEAPPEVEPAVDAAPIPKQDPPSVQALQAIASAKSKIVGVERVKATISLFGAKTINDLDDAKRIALHAAFEALEQ